MNNEIFKKKWFWIVAPILVWIVLGFFVTLLQNASATPISSCGEHQQCIEYEVGNIAAVVSGGNVISKLLMPHSAHVGDVSGFSNFVSTPGVSGTPTITYTISDVNGCTVGTQTNQSTITTTFTTWATDVPLTLTDTTCSGLFRIVIIAGTVPTEIVDIMHRFVIFAENDIENFNKSCEVSSFWNSQCNNTDFYNFIGSNVFEFFTLILILIIAIIVWSRSTDYAIRFAMTGLTFIPALIWLGLYAANGFEILVLSAILTFIIGGYMAVRASMDLFEERQNPQE